MSTKIRRSERNFVEEASRIKLNLQETKKQYIPGIYAQHHPSQCEHKLNSRPIHLKLRSAMEGKDVAQLVTAENVRDLLIPSHNVNVYPTIWAKKEMGRIKSVGKIVTKAERQAALEAREMEKKRLKQECEKRKKVLKDMDRKRQETKEKKIDEDTDNEDTAAKILDRAFLAKQEESEEVKKANRIILATKCHVIRDAQIAEKTELEQELRDEDLRLEKMMLSERDKALQDEDRRREELKGTNLKHATDLKKQLNDREMAKLIQVEQIEEEAKAMKRAGDALKEYEKRQEQSKRENMLKFRGELQKCNKLSAFYKSLAFEEQRVAEMKAMEYMRQKQEQEKQLAHERKLLMEQRQREADRLLEQQTKLLMTRNEQGEMELRRNQEEKERAFRRQEKEVALKKIQQNKELEAARLTQINEVRRRRAQQLEEEELEFKQTVSKFKELETKEKEKQEMNLKNQEKYRSDIINQMNEKEKRRQQEDKLSKTEFKTILDKEKQRKKDIQSVINAKIKAMRAAKIPDKFIKDVERQLQATLNEQQKFK